MKHNGELDNSRAVGFLRNLLLGKAWNTWVAHHQLCQTASKVGAAPATWMGEGREGRAALHRCCRATHLARAAAQPPTPPLPRACLVAHLLCLEPASSPPALSSPVRASSPACAVPRLLSSMPALTCA